MRDVRSTTLNVARMSKRDLYRMRLDPSDGKTRHLPMTRAECVDGVRPCPYVSCRHHLYLDVSDVGGIKLNFPDLEPEDLPVSCALDVAELDGSTLAAAGAVMNVTRERIRQIEERAMKKLRKRLERWRISLDDLTPVQAVSWFGDRD